MTVERYLNAIDYSDKFASGASYVVKIGKMVFLSFSGVPKATMSAWTVLVNIDERIKPGMSWYSSASCGTNSFGINLNSNGTISTSNPITTTDRINFFTVYFTTTGDTSTDLSTT